jgi:hypothetical protein
MGTATRGLFSSLSFDAYEGMVTKVIIIQNSLLKKKAALLEYGKEFTLMGVETPRVPNNDGPLRSR